MRAYGARGERKDVVEKLLLLCRRQRLAATNRGTTSKGYAEVIEPVAGILGSGEGELGGETGGRVGGARQRGQCSNEENAAAEGLAFQPKRGEFVRAIREAGGLERC